MVTYFVMALAVALLAGLTGGMPSPALRPQRRANESRDEDLAAGFSPRIDGAKQNAWSEIVDAPAEADRLSPVDAPAEPPRGEIGEDSHVNSVHSPILPPRNSISLVGDSQKMLKEIVDSLVQGTQFIALTGTRGAGKTALAMAIWEELHRHSVSVRWIDGAHGSGIPLRVIMSRVLGKSETDIGTEDIEQLFDTMTEREATDRLVLIIDDAEQLLPDATGYLRLLANVAIDRMPQIVFVGDPSFWGIAAKTAGFDQLIAVRFELDGLSQEGTCTATDQLASPPTATKPASRIAASAPSDYTSDATIGSSDAVSLVLQNPLQSRRFAQLAGAAAIIVAMSAVPTRWLVVPGVTPISAEESFGRPRTVDSGPIVVRLSSSTKISPDASEPDDSRIRPVAEFSVAADVGGLPRQISGRPFDSAPALHKHTTRAPPVQKQRSTASYSTGSSSGTWLFQPNPNSGG